MKASDYPIHAVSFSHVTIEDLFWRPRREVNSRVTIWDNFRKCEETGRVANFEKAAGLREGLFEGMRFNDSDVYKTIEAASYSLLSNPDPVLERYVDSLIALIAAAQWPDGYLDTFYSLGAEEPDPRFPMEAQVKGARWTNLRYMHELYCAGHLMEAAVAYYEATGKGPILDVAKRLADHLDATFSWDKKRGTSGHEEVELGLCRLYRATGESRYLKLAKYFLDQRGRREGRAEPDYGEYAQDHEPVLEQDEAVGHAVRAGYLYTAMADVAALTGDTAYISAIDRIWENVVSKKYYVTGGVGAIPPQEAYGGNYELPNKTAFNETCAAIAAIFWFHRMFMLHGDSKYIDVMERTLYNGFLSGVSFGGDEYLYSNPLESDGVTRFNRGYPARSPWFDCSCCPPNVARLLASLPGYVYAVSGNTVYVNLFIAGRAIAELPGSKVIISQSTDYPWRGDIKIAIEPETPGHFTVAIRIPGWANGTPVPSDLYNYLNTGSDPIAIRINGKEADYQREKGYARITRTWRREEIIDVRLPMEVRRVVANERVKEDIGLVAVERGPIIFCAEGADNGRLEDLALPDDAKLHYAYSPNLLCGVGTVSWDAGGGRRPLMIPYCAWSNRGVGTMKVWLPRKVNG